MRSITLEPAETTLVRHLDQYSKTCIPPVECRIAGGWVRDKLLGLPSSDLDIALTTTSGHSFALGFVDYLQAQSVATGSVGKVAANPDQSKHLETGTTRIMGLECDFVGLRSETYADTRIPDQVRLGTPLEDASRRDLTINALFYNVHSRSVEDYTEHGLEDLSRKIARTPLPPTQTFHDDPLRVLRCVRFASRFNLTIVDEIIAAIQQQPIQAALRSKVSRERVGIEVTKMLKGNPLASLELIESLDLYTSIFDCGIQVSGNDALATAQILSHLPFETDAMLWFAAATSPFRDKTVKGKKDLPAVSVLISEGLKLPNEVKVSVTNLFDAWRLIDPLCDVRSHIGNTLRSVQPWQRSITWATVMAILPTWRGVWDGHAEQILQRYQQYVRRICDLDLPDDLDRPPLLDGKKLQGILGIRPSPLISVVLQAVLTWQLEHPKGTEQECTTWVQSMWHGEGRAQWESSLPPKGEKRKR